MEYIDPNIYKRYFADTQNATHRQFLALRKYFLDGCSAQEVADEFGYSVNTVYSLARDFKKKLSEHPETDPFFITNRPGRRRMDEDDELVSLIIALRKKYFSVPEIKSIMDVQDMEVSERSITKILKKDGFGRLPRRDDETRDGLTAQATELLSAPKARKLTMESESFTSQLAAILCFLPLISTYGLDKAISASAYLGTRSVGKLSSILCFLALKLSNVRRYSTDDTWCMDRGMGLFAGLNVLPKATWYSAYSSGITTDMNRNFLKSLCRIWIDNGFLSDTANLDFTTIPYWGDDSSLENNWSGKRGKALTSMLALLSQDPDSGIICYGDTTIRHENQNEAVLEFLDFYRENEKEGPPLQYLVFDSRFTSYENLNKLNKNSIKFITIRRRGKKLVERIDGIPNEQWNQTRVPKANGRSRMIRTYEESVEIKGYEGALRQIFITGHGKIKPAIIITNELEMPIEKVVRKYSRRWLIEKGISEQIEFFHLNRNCSGMVIKVDFDLTMTILAHNLYRILAMHLTGYSSCMDQTIYEKFIQNAGEVIINDSVIEVKLKRKRNLPLLLEQMNELDGMKFSWLNGSRIKFTASTTT